MSNMVEPPRPHAPPDPVKPVTSPALPDASVLEDKTPAWLRMPAVSSLFVMAIGAVFVVMANRPLWHTDLWDHLNYGEYILSTHQVPQTEPLLELARGMPMIDIPWLAQLGMAALSRTWGLPALQFVFALLIAGSLAVVSWRAVKLSGSVWGGLLAAAIVLVMNYQQFLVIRPQMAGVLFFCVTAAWAMSRHRGSRAAWTGLPLMFAVWANFHGSFAMGLMLMGLTALGRFTDVWFRTRSLRLAFSDRESLTLLLIMQLCSAAVLANPSGFGIYPEVLNVAASPNIDSMFEWNALTLRMKQGQWAAAVTGLLLVSLRLSPRRFRWSEILPLTVTGLLACWSARMINWWAPLMGILTATHLVAAVRASRRTLRPLGSWSSSGLWTVVNVGLCWILFAVTNFGVQVVHARVPEMSRLVSRQTPLLLADYLGRQQDNLPRGIAFVPAEWSGFVIHAGPDTVRPMVNLHVHLIPVEVWNDYLRLLHGPSDSEPLLDQYGINLVILDRQQQPGLLKRLVDNENWTARYQDNQAIVFSRNDPI